MKYMAILGAGPAGLLAAHACALTGVPFAIFSKAEGGEPVKSRLGGAQFVHRPIPGIHEEGNPDGMIKYKVVGSTIGYRQKVYGSEPVPFVSMEHVQDGQEVPCWSLSGTYDRLWSGIAGDGGSITQADVDALLVQELLDSGDFMGIISTVPKPAICKTLSPRAKVNWHMEERDGERVMVSDGPPETYEPPHTFSSQRIHIMNRSILLDGASENTVVYDGTPFTSWYRTSMIFGVGSTEWSDSATVPPYIKDEPMVTANKPMFTNCTCWREESRLKTTGRYGAWRKGALVHDAFVDTVGHMERSGIVNAL